MVELIFSGLVKYDGKGKIVPDLAKSFEIKDDGKTYEFYLRDDILWHDGEQFTNDDVIFTIKTIQNADYKSPLRANWLGVEVEKINESGIRLKLKSPYASFLENCTVKILPKHIWQDIPPENFALTVYNLQPIGTGPFKFKNFKQDKLGYIKSFTLSPNLRYYKEGPYISEITFQYFKDEKEALNSLKNGGVDGLSYLPAKDLNQIKGKALNVHRLSLPRYFSVFLNTQKATIFQDKNIRQALDLGTNKEDLIKKVLLGEGEIVLSPILPEIFGFEKPNKISEFNPEKAKEILEKAGFQDVNGDGFREKIIKKQVFQFKSDLRTGSQGNEVTELQKCLAQDSEIYPDGKITGTFGENTKIAVIKFQEKYKKEILEPAGLQEGTGEVGKATRQKLNELCAQSPEELQPFELSIITINQPELMEVANFLKNNWQEILGLKLEIQLYDNPELENEIIKPRNYQALLFGEVLNLTPDPFPFWHSSQKKDPGLNLAIFENKQTDKLLEDARQNLNAQERKQKYEEFQDILIEEVPVIFLYSPNYIYPISKEIKGVDVKIIVDPSKRFSNIEDWYIATERSWK